MSKSGMSVCTSPFALYLISPKTQDLQMSHFHAIFVRKGCRLAFDFSVFPPQSPSCYILFFFLISKIGWKQLGVVPSIKDTFQNTRVA